jgi:hypothetical protein
MITTETPYKLSEIIRDTWPNLYRPPKQVEKPIDEKCKEV